MEENVVEVVVPSCECECGKHDGPVEYVINPYDEDVNGVTNWQWLCARCYDDSAGDI